MRNCPISFPCEAKTAPKSSFLFSFHELYCRPVSFLLPGWLTPAELWCWAGPVPLSHPWSSAALFQGGRGAQDIPSSLSVRCRAPCAQLLLVSWKCSCRAQHTGTLEDHRAADWPLPCQRWTAMRCLVLKALYLITGFVPLLTSSPLCHFQELFLVISVYMFWFCWISGKSGCSFTPLQMKVVQLLKSKKSANNYFLGKVKCDLPHYSKLIKAGLQSCPLGYTLVPGDNTAKYT